MKDIKINRRLCLALVFLLAFTLFSGCKDNLASRVRPGDDWTVIEGVHSANVSETGKNISESGFSDYKIVISQKAGIDTIFAAKELQLFLKNSGRDGFDGNTR